MSNHMNLRGILDANKLTGPNFLDWHRNLRIVLKHEKIGYVLEHPLPEVPTEDSTVEEVAAYNKHSDDDNTASCVMLAAMSPELQKQHDGMDAYTMIFHLKELYDEQSRVERYETSKQLYRCKMGEGSSVSAHVLKMIGYIEKLAQLGSIMDHELSVDLVLQSLPDSYSQFIMNFNMNKIECSLPELLNMLKTVEPNVKVSSGHVLAVQSSKGTKRKIKGSFKKTSKKAKNNFKTVKANKDNTKSDDPCYHCGVKGHWKRNCKAYLAGLKGKKSSEASSSGILVIEVNMSTSLASWVLDTGCGSHICINMQGLKKSRPLQKRKVDLRVGNGARVAALAVGTYFLPLPSGLVLELENCYFVPAITKNIISISCLDMSGFSINVKNNRCSLYRDEIFYGCGVLQNGIYILDTESSIMSIENKRHKNDSLNNTYLWHCRLGHINEKRISKLHRDGYLGSKDFESFDKCESCLLGKMTKFPFTGKGERVHIYWA